MKTNRGLNKEMVMKIASTLSTTKFTAETKGEMVEQVEALVALADSLETIVNMVNYSTWQAADHISAALNGTQGRLLETVSAEEYDDLFVEQQVSIAKTRTLLGLSVLAQIEALLSTDEANYKAMLALSAFLSDDEVNTLLRWIGDEYPEDFRRMKYAALYEKIKESGTATIFELDLLYSLESGVKTVTVVTLGEYARVSLADVEPFLVRIK